MLQQPRTRSQLWYAKVRLQMKVLIMTILSLSFFSVILFITYNIYVELGKLEIDERTWMIQVFS